MDEVSTRQGAVRYRAAGAGPPVLLLHATLHDQRDFDPIFDVLAERHRVVALDWPHHGRSAHEGPLPSAMDLAGTLVDIVDGLSLGPTAFLGSSVGGYAAARLALERPAAVTGLVLVNAGGFTRPTLTTRVFCRLMGRPAVTRRVLPLLVGRYMRAQSGSDRAIAARARSRAASPDGAAVAAALWRSFADPAHDLRERARAIEVPTLVLWGAKDVLLRVKDGRAAHAAITGSALHTFPTGHVPFSSQPEDVLDVLLPFLASVTAGRAGRAGRPSV